MMMKVIGCSGDKSNTLELCSLNNTLVNFRSQKKDYAFVVKLLSVMPLHPSSTNNHILMVYYDKQVSKTCLEIFRHPLLTRC